MRLLNAIRFFSNWTKATARLALCINIPDHLHEFNRRRKHYRFKRRSARRSWSSPSFYRNSNYQRYSRPNCALRVRTSNVAATVKRRYKSFYSDRSSQSGHSSQAEIYEKVVTISTQSHTKVSVFRPAFPDTENVFIQNIICSKPVAAYFAKRGPSVAFFRIALSLPSVTLQPLPDTLLVTHITRNSDLYAARTRCKIINFTSLSFENLLSVGLHLGHLTLSLYAIAIPRTFVTHRSILQLTGRFDTQQLSKETLQSGIKSLLVTVLPQDFRLTKCEDYSIFPPEQIPYPIPQLAIGQFNKSNVPLQTFTIIKKRISLDGVNDIVRPITTSHHVMHNDICNSQMSSGFIKGSIDDWGKSTTIHSTNHQITSYPAQNKDLLLKSRVAGFQPNFTKDKSTTPLKGCFREVKSDKTPALIAELQAKLDLGKNQQKTSLSTRVRFVEKTTARLPCPGLYLNTKTHNTISHSRKSVKSLISQFELIGGAVPLMEEPEIFYFDTILFG